VSDHHYYLVAEKDAKKQRVVYKESGAVRNVNGTYRTTILKKDVQLSGLNQYVKMHVVQSDGKLYIEATPIEEKDTKSLKSLVEAAHPYHGMEHLKNAPEYTYWNNVKKMGNTSSLSIPVSFMRKTDARHSQKLNIWVREEDKTIIIEGKPIYCDICGKPINRYYNKAYELHVCRKCSHNTKIINRLIKNMDGDFEVDPESIKIQNVFKDLLNRFDSMINKLEN
jgi:hypothetical protein